MMQYQRLGRTGLKVSRLSLGTWITFGHQLDSDQARELVHCAFAAGVNLFDTAEGYADGRAEEMLGAAVRSLGVGRDAYCLSSKVFYGGSRPTQTGLSRKHVTDACHASLRRLNTDYIDILYCHRRDPETPMVETIGAMNTLMAQGKILYWGVSRWPSWDIERCIRAARRAGLEPPVAEQPEYNLLQRRNVELGLAPVAARHGLGILATGALASGILTGKYEQSAPAGARLTLREFKWLEKHLPPQSDVRTRETIAMLRKSAQSAGYTPAQLAIAWCLRNPAVSSIVLGASAPSQLEENLKALLACQELDATVFAQIERVAEISLLARLRHTASYALRSTMLRFRQA